MTRELTQIDLTDEQKGQVYGILSVGCDRQTAADYVGCSLADIRRTMGHDSAFAASVRRAEAQVELTHMRNVQTTAEEKKEWRASVWWLECRSPERFGRRAPGAITARQLKEFIAILADTLGEVMPGQDEQQHLSARLQSLADSVDKMMREDLFIRPDTDDPANQSALERSLDASDELLTNDCETAEEEVE